MPPETELTIARRIIYLRGQKVLLDHDIAAVYGVATKAVNRAVSRNRSSFPADFMFQLTADEARNLRYQIGTLGHGTYSKYRPCREL